MYFVLHIPSTVQEIGVLSTEYRVQCGGVHRKELAGGVPLDWTDTIMKATLHSTTSLYCTGQYPPHHPLNSTPNSTQLQQLPALYSAFHRLTRLMQAQGSRPQHYMGCHKLTQPTLQCTDPKVCEQILFVNFVLQKQEIVNI